MSILSRRGLILEIGAVAVLLTMGAFLRFYEIRTRPGFEWDEPLYAAIAQNTAKYGYPTLQVEEGRPLTPHLYHPPFDHYLKGYWFEVTGASGIGQARILAGIESMVLLLLTYFFVRYVAGKEAALLALLLVSSDGWLVYTNRLNLIENSMMTVGLVGVYLYAVALKRDRMWYYALAGVVLALSAVYKHTGLYFLLVPILTWLLTRKSGEHHLVLLLVATIVILFYVAGMSYFFGADYWFQTLVQLRRALGMGGSSRGLTYGLTEVIQALTNAYWIFFTTIASLIIGGVMVMIRFIQYLTKRQPHGYPILLSWSAAAVLLLAVVALKSPQYWIIILVPLYAFLVSELGPFLWRREATILAISSLVVTVVAVLGLNLVTWYFLIDQQTNNALLETYDYAAQFIPNDARVLTEECIGVQLGQTYYNIQIHRGVEDLQRIDPTYVILYYSTTAKPPASPGLDTLLQHSTFVTKFSSFKEVIEIYRVEPREVEVKNVLLAIKPLVTATPMLTLTPTLTATPTEPLPTSVPTRTSKVMATEESTATTEKPFPTSTPKTLPTEELTATPTPTAAFSLAEKPSVPEKTYYVVKWGDSLIVLAQRFYGDWKRWRDIYEANREVIQNPNQILPGQLLKIPK